MQNYIKYLIRSLNIQLWKIIVFRYPNWGDVTATLIEVPFDATLNFQNLFILNIQNIIQKYLLIKLAIFVGFKIKNFRKDGLIW